MLTDQQVSLLREQLATAKNPLFLFDDDPDGLCSFLLLYRMHREGHGSVVKSVPKIDSRLLRKVEENRPDQLFILDIPLVEQDFIDQIHLPIFWIDHHGPYERQNIHYFNPRLQDPSAYIPTTRLAYQLSQKPEDLWIALVGCLGDYHLPDLYSQFSKQYPDLTENNAELDRLIYETPIGKLVRIFSFLLKGKTSEVNKCIKILTRIKTPYEILHQQTPQGKYLYKRFEHVDQKYQELLNKAQKTRTKGPLLIFIYSQQSWSFTSELSNELSHLNPQKIIIVARKKSGEIKCSLRSKELNLPSLLEKALPGLDGYGGGHEHACGANIKEEDWEQFLLNLKRELK